MKRTPSAILLMAGIVFAITFAVVMWGSNFINGRPSCPADRAGSEDCSDNQWAQRQAWDEAHENDDHTFELVIAIVTTGVVLVKMMLDGHEADIRDAAFVASLDSGKKRRAGGKKRSALGNEHPGS